MANSGPRVHAEDPWLEPRAPYTLQGAPEARTPSAFRSCFQKIWTVKNLVCPPMRKL